jgi:hypothetical protein
MIQEQQLALEKEKEAREHMKEEKLRLCVLIFCCNLLEG